MNFDWKNIDLRNASIFDLTDDLELIRECIADEDITMDDKEEYLKRWNTMYIACDMSVFADKIKDKALQKELERVFAKEYAEYEAIFDE